MAANQIQQILVKRGNTASISSYTGPLGELVLNTQTNQLVAQDGITPGGRLVTGDTFPIVANLTVLQREVANIAGISGNVAQLQSFFANVNLEGISTTIANLQLAANSSYGNANAAAYLPIYGGTVGTNLINFTNSNGQIESGETTGQPNSSWIEMTANIQHDIAGFYAAENGSAQVYSAQDVLLFSNTIGSTAPLWTFDRTGNLNLPSTTGRILFPYNENSNAIIDYSQDIGQFFVIQNNFVDGHQGINLDTDDAQVQISSKNSGGYPLRTWNFDWQGQLTYPDSTIQITAYQGPAGQTSFATQANVITANTSMKGYVDNQITLLVNNAPAILDTLGQIAANLQADESSLTRVILGQAAANTQISALQANVGSYYIWANANTAGLYNSIVGANTAWTANAATQQGLITALQANTGGLYNSIAGANSTIQALSANVGSFYTWANTNFGTSSYANANVAAYIAGNVTIGNATATSFRSNNFLYPNGVSILSGYSTLQAPSTLDDTQQLPIIVYKSSTTQLVTGSGNAGSVPTYQPHTGTLNAWTFTAQSTSGVGISATANIVGGNLITTGSIVGNVIYGNSFVYANGVSILTGIGGTYSNTNVTAYLAGNISTGNVRLSSGSWLDFINSDLNWRIGYNLGSYTKTTAQTTIDVVVGQGQAGPDGFSVGQTGGTSIFELVGYTKNAWFANNVTVVGNVTSGNVLASGFFYANGTPFTSSSYGNTQVAAYLVANPPAGTYSNSNVAAYLTTQTFYSNSNVAAYLVANPQGSTYSNANVTAYLSNSTASTGNVYAGNLIASGNVYGQNFVGNITTGANITASYFITTGAYGNISQVNTISANNYVYANGVSILTGITAGTGTYSNANVAAYLTTQTFYSNSNIASYLVNNPQAGTYSNSNVAAYLTTQTFYSNANVTSYLAANPQGSTYSNANIVANLQNYVTNISSTANIATTANMIAPNYLFANGVNILSTITPSSSYSNTNVAAYLTTQTFYSNSNVASYLVANPQAGTYSNSNVASYLTANPQGSTYSNANVVANLANYVTNIISTANITANYFIGNGAALSSLTYASIGNIYGSSSNVTLQAGNYNWTFDNTGNLSIPTNGNIIWANGTVFSSGTGGSGSSGTLYTNANVVSMLAANTAVFIGNVGVIGNVATGNIQANATAIFLGGNTVISNYGSPTFGYATHIGNNIYFDANGTQRYRNTQTGAADLIVAPGTLNFYATGGAVTANTATGYTGATSLYMALSTSGMSLYNNAGLVSSGPVTIQNATGLVTNQGTIGLFQNASTINAGTASGILSVGQSGSGTGSLGNVTIGAGTIQTGAVPLTVRASGTYNILIVYGIGGGYNSPPYYNQSVTGGSGTGMTASYSSGSGYIAQSSLVVTNPGTGYKNGDIVALPGGGSTAQLYNYNPNISNGTTVGTANYVFGIDGNLTLPGNVTLASNAVVAGDFSNSTFNYRTVFRTTTANATTGIYAVPSGTGTGAAWQAANSSNIANTSKIMITTNGSTDVQLVSGINGTGTYLPLSFLTNGSTQMQLDTAGNLLMVTGGNISTTGNVIAGNIVANHYGNSIGTTATYSGNITAGNIISNGNIAMVSNIARNVYVNSVAPISTQGNVGDIWYQTY